ncbi:hypothetical protein J3Q64DRAFT_1693671 [Phycomyces blakesleeanus]|uniref:RNI-like protein n=2 Tax=Phycomyces blakesleeanus TaxID=4837 RepID=A0A162TAJ1_PHYB8|nr:hypothetical protein PHYBLDRAFT_174598 [Phycomyces blakesleeanus NRRL 1555(-)]OAD67212.1 hypothetical protein PHYBLDRAFT_174598 [Phycomyces blakesleeanus NRRL 1555(-)]|eukprot:XP_018285252.1 hypothetical protein PHYBLDRAFT_174598 [Phycomyces blakesleeanus NRRL 1555(-)]
MGWGDSDNSIEKWVKQLKSNDPTLKSLHILSFRVVTPSQFASLFTALAQNKTLKELYCSGHALDTNAVEQLSEALTLNDTLESLNVGNSEFGSVLNGKLMTILCEGLAVNEGLVKIDLENKGLTMGSITTLAECLKKNERLQNLNLSRNSIDDTSFPEFAKAIPQTNLRELNVSMNSIGPVGARILADNLGKLEVLDISDNPLMEGASALGHALATNQHLHTLKMMSVSSPEQELSLPPAATAENENEEENKDGELEEPAEEEDDGRSVHGNSLFEAILASIDSNSKLTHLWLDSNGIETSAFKQVENLAKSSLVDIRLRRNKIDDKAIESLTKVIPQSLVHLELGENQIGGLGLWKLLSTHLHYIGLFSNQVGGFSDYPDILPVLTQSGARSLDIGCNKVTRQDMEAVIEILLGQGVPHLKLLEIGGNAEEKDKDAWESAVGRLKEIREDLEVAWKRLMSGEMNEPGPM